MFSMLQVIKPEIYFTRLGDNKFVRQIGTCFNLFPVSGKKELNSKSKDKRDDGKTKKNYYIGNTG